MMDIPHFVSREVLLNLDFNLLGSKWNPENIGFMGELLCLSKELVLRTSSVIRSSMRSLNYCRNFYNFATYFLYENFMLFIVRLLKHLIINKLMSMCLSGKK